MITTVYKTFSLQVTNANKTYSKTFELDKNLVLVRGVLMDADKPEQIYFRGTQRIEINKYELFPANHLSRRLMAGLEVPSNQHYHNLGRIDTGNKIVKIEFTDTDAAGAAFSAYTVYLSLKCFQDDSK